MKYNFNNLKHLKLEKQDFERRYNNIESEIENISETIKTLQRASSTLKKESDTILEQVEIREDIMIEQANLYYEEKLKRAKSNYFKWQLMLEKKKYLKGILNSNQKHNLFCKLHTYHQRWKNEKLSGKDSDRVINQLKEKIFN